MAEEGFKRKLAAILSADVEGYSRLMDDDEEATVRTLTSYRTAISDLVQQYGGRVVDSPGDNILAEFKSVVDAVNSAVKIQRELAERNADLPDERKMQFRIGVNLGDVIDEEERIYGDGVNIAARIESLSDAGGICISHSAYDQIKNKLKFGYEYLGEHDVKNIREPVKAYRVLMAPEFEGKFIGFDKKASKKGWIWVAAAAVVVAVVGLGIWQFYMRRPTIEPASEEKMAFPLPDKPSIAVLAFDNLSGDPEQEYFSDGITEDIITALSKTPKMFVIARNSTFTYKGKPVKVQQVAEELGVRYVLEGSVRTVGEKVRITAQLIDAKIGHHLWAEKYDRELKDIFALQDEVTKSIIAELQVKLTDGEQARIRAKGTNNLNAYLKVLEARELVRAFNIEKNSKAHKLLEEAIELDPNYAPAYRLLGSSHFVDVVIGTSKSPRDSFKKAVELSKKALSIDKSLGDAHGLIGTIYVFSKQYEKGMPELEKAVELYPNGSDAHAYLAGGLLYADELDEAILVSKKALRLNPMAPSWYLNNLAAMYRCKGNYEEALVWSEKAVKQEPEYIIGRIHLSSIYSLLGRMEEAHLQANEVMKLNPKFYVKKLERTLPYKNAEVKKRYIEALRNAGLPYEPPLPLPDKPSIAVLAFDNLSGDPEQEYFSDGISENIITALSKVGELFVIARNSSFTYKGKPVKVKQVGRELGVRYVLEGSVQKSGDRVRITAQLIDAKNEQHVWAERYDRVLKDIFVIQDDITKRVVSSLQANLTVGEITRAYAKGTNSLEAYLKVMKARNIHMRFTNDDNLISRDLTQEAIAIDPEYGEAYVLLAATYMLETLFESEKSPKELMGQAIKYAKKAVELETVGGHSMLGHLYSFIGQIDKGLSECKIAVDLAPNSASARTWYGAVLIKAGQYDMAVEQLEQALRRDPMAGTWTLRYLGSAYSWKGRHEEAISTLKKASEKAPKDYLSRLFLTRAYIFAGRPDDAKAEAAEVIRLNPNFSLEKFAKTYNAKDKDRAINALRQAGLK
jgi:adenylate cyclase